MAEILWEPSPERVASTHLTSFMHRHGFDDYASLWQWSVDDRAAFWSAVWEEGSVVASETSSTAIGTEAMPGTDWFPGARLNFAENLLRRADSGIAVIAMDESGTRRDVTWAELSRLVAAAQRGLTKLGVGVGDRVAALLPNGLEALVGMLATTASGAIWSSCSPDFGPLGVVDRFGQIEPTVLITVDGYHYNGSPHRVADTVNAVIDALPNLSAVVAVDRLGEGLDTGDVISVDWDTSWPMVPSGPSSSNCPSTIPSTSSTHRGRPDLPRASCTVLEGPCSST